MDDVDKAQSTSEMFLEKKLRNHQPLSIPFSGFCLSCSEPVRERRFCDSSCRENFEKEQKLKFRSSRN